MRPAKCAGGKLKRIAEDMHCYFDAQEGDTVMLLKINDYRDRQKLCKILRYAGYAVEVVELPTFTSVDYYVQVSEGIKYT